MALLASPSFDLAIPTPKSVIGFKPGQRPATPAQIVEYFEVLAESTPRARLKVMGHTHEGRPLIVLAVSSEANLARSEEVSTRLRQASDPRITPSASAALRAVRDLPAVAWMGYSIHGNEVSGSDASMPVAYRLVAGTDPQTKMWRQNVITYIDPLQNPDGRQRAVATYESNRSEVPDLDIVSLPNAEMWPYGRGNHYLFDLNRDWFALVQPESRARVPLIARLLPQLQVDAHEMGSNSSYLFSPPRMPFNPHRPKTHHLWEQRFARDQARAFDERGWSYYTREWNEEFYAGYGSSWIIYLGAIGI
ncbi:MAG: M14 family zinc carboxypeptidase, partial [Myxococcota bacterium]